MKKYGIVSVLVVMCMMNFTGLVQADIPRNGLVAEYLFDGNANDTSGRGHHGTVNGATLTADRFGNTNSAYNFTNSNYIRVENNSDFQFGNGAITISAWFKASQGNNFRCIVGKQASYGGWGGFVLRIADNGRLQFFARYCGSSACGYNAGTSQTIFSSNRVDNNVLHHAVGVRLSTGECRLYLDGVLVGAFVTPTTTISNTDPLFIGVQNTGAMFPFQGIIDDVFIFNRGLSADEIKQLYTASNTSTVCTTEYVPVCGIDGKTYSNECEANKAGVEIDYTGECLICNTEYVPVCGIDGKTYSNECEANKAGVEIDHTGTCNIDTECPVAVDSDKDGIIDELDICPNTPEGSAVYSNGCPTEAIYSQSDLEQAVASAVSVKDNEIAILTITIEELESNIQTITQQYVDALNTVNNEL